VSSGVASQVACDTIDPTQLGALAIRLDLVK